MPALVTGQVSDRDLFYRSYVQTYLERDVRELTQVGDLNAFGRFLRAVAARTAQMLNYTDLARTAPSASTPPEMDERSGGQFSGGHPAGLPQQPVEAPV